MKPLRFKDNLEKAMKAKGLTGSELARQVGISQSAISLMLSGKTADPKMLVVSKIADVLGVTVEELMYGVVDPVAVKTELPPRAHTVPLLNWVQAGNFTQINPQDVEEWFLCPSNIGPQGFALTVRGESMEPEFHTGDVVFVDPDRQWSSGSIVIVVDLQYGDASATMKKLVEEENGRRYLRPLNPAWPEQFIQFTPTMRIIGTVIGKYSLV